MQSAQVLQAPIRQLAYLKVEGVHRTRNVVTKPKVRVPLPRSGIQNQSGAMQSAQVLQAPIRHFTYCFTTSYENIGRLRLGGRNAFLTVATSKTAVASLDHLHGFAKPSVASRR